jgi:glycine betaine/proline transport system permease protein
MAVPTRAMEVELTAAAEPSSAAAHRTPSPWPRRVLWLVGVVVGAVVGLLFFSGGFPESLTVNAARPFTAFQNWVIDNPTNPLFAHVLNPLRNAINSAFDSLVTGLARLTWLGFLVFATVIAGILAGLRMAILTAAGFLVLGLLGLWQPGIETLALILFAVTVSLAIGIPVGIVAGRHPGVERILRPILDAMQTIPAFSYLVPVVLLFSIGTTSALIATVIFALPPAIRLTSLGIQLVPSSSVEVGQSFGATPWQVLRRVQLPLAKPSIMLGINQTIMMALGIVVIAATVGFQGLGREVYNALQTLNVGKALAAGLGIVVLAIVLDRVTHAWSERDRTHRGSKTVRVLGWRVSRSVAAAVGLVLAIVAVVVGRQVLRQQDFPDGWTISIAGPVNDIVAAITRTIGDFTKALSDAIVRFALDPIRDLLTGLPWWMACGGAALLAWRVARRPALVVLSFLCLFLIGVFGMWDISMDTLSQVIVAAGLSVAIAIPIGIWSSRHDGVRRALRPALDAMQTMPQFVYLVPVIALFHVGRVPGVIAALVYALPPGIRLTEAGIRQVPSETVEAAVAYGATPNQLLRKVQLPLARPSILLGVNQTIMMVLSVVIIAGLTGGGALGHEVINGLSHDPAKGMVAGICILLLAIVIDRITQAMGQGRGTTASRRRAAGWLFGTTRTRAVAARQGVSDTPTAGNEGKGEA